MSQVVVVRRAGLSQQLMTRLRAAAIGDVVTWEELEALTGQTRKAVQDMVIDAKKVLLVDDKMHYRTVTSVGVERIGFATVVHEELPARRQRIGAAAGRMVLTTQNIIVEGLSKDDRDQVYLHQTLGGLTQSICANESVRRLRASVSDCETVAPLSPREAAERLFAK
jgi:hypothetical protein